MEGRSDERAQLQKRFQARFGQPLPKQGATLRRSPCSADGAWDVGKTSLRKGSQARNRSRRWKDPMAFKRAKGVAGLVYVPDERGGAKKHRCRDCHFCQWCSDERCRLCRGAEPRGGACEEPGRKPRRHRVTR